MPQIGEESPTMDMWTPLPSVSASTEAHYILLSVAVPDELDEHEQRAKWRTLVQRLEPLAKTTKDIVRLGEGVWLLPRDQGMTFAAECIAVARASSLKAEARFLSEDDEPSS
jgi:hypothetical protein